MASTSLSARGNLVAQQLAAMSEQVAWNEERRKNDLAMRGMEAQVKEKEAEQQMLSQVADQLAGYGTPEERSQVLYRPGSTTEKQALAGGEMMSNVAQPFSTFVGNPQYPSTKNVQPLARALMNKKLLGTALSPEEHFQQQVVLQNMGIEKQGQMEKAKDVRQQKFLEGTAQRQEAQQKVTIGVQLGTARLNNLHKQAFDTEKVYKSVTDKHTAAVTDQSINMKGAKEAWENKLRDAKSIYDSEKNRISMEIGQTEKVLAPFYEQMGYPIFSQQQGQQQVDPIEQFRSYIKSNVDETTANALYLQGLTPDLIYKRAQQIGRSPEEYLNAILEVSRRKK